MKNYSQRDPRWSHIRLGDSVITCGTDGCLVCTICDLISYFYPKHEYPEREEITPAVLISLLEFTSDSHKLGGGLILWSDKNKAKFKELGIEMIRRVGGDIEQRLLASRIGEIKAYAKDPEYAVGLEVKTRYGGRHWLGVMGRSLTWRGLGWYCQNPWTGSAEPKTVGYGAPYVMEIGYLLFKKFEPNAPK